MFADTHPGPLLSLSGGGQQGRPAASSSLAATSSSSLSSTAAGTSQVRYILYSVRIICSIPPPHPVYFLSAFSPAPSLFVTQTRGHIATTPPPPFPLRHMPSFFPRERCSVSFPRQLASNRAYTCYQAHSACQSLHKKKSLEVAKSTF